MNTRIITNQDVEVEPNFDLIDNPQPEERKTLFRVRQANQCIDDAKKEPIPHKLCDEFWWENELCILFADTNSGKTALAVQIADTVSRGDQCADFPTESLPQTVVYFDFEMSDKQFEGRYSENYQNHHIFSERFLRVDMCSPENQPEGIKWEDWLKSEIEVVVEETGAKVIIIDNLVALNSSTEDASKAIPLMLWLKEWKKRKKVSILVLAHTPKRPKSRPIESDNLAGSKNLMNFADSSFTMGTSCKGNNIRYLKQIKGREKEYKYLTDSVAVCHFEKENGNFLKLKFDEIGREYDHLARLERGDYIDQAKELSQQGLSQRQIADTLGVSASTVNAYLKKGDGGE